MADPAGASTATAAAVTPRCSRPLLPTASVHSDEGTSTTTAYSSRSLRRHGRLHYTPYPFTGHQFSAPQDISYTFRTHSVLGPLPPSERSVMPASVGMPSLSTPPPLMSLNADVYTVDIHHSLRAVVAFTRAADLVCADDGVRWSYDPSVFKPLPPQSIELDRGIRRPRVDRGSPSQSSEHSMVVITSYVPLIECHSYWCITIYLLTGRTTGTPGWLCCLEWYINLKTRHEYGKS